MMLTFEAEDVLGEQAVQHFEGLLQKSETGRDRMQLDSEGRVFAFMPPGTDADLEPALRHAIEGHRLLGEDRRMPERVGTQHGSKADSIGNGCQSAEQRPGIHDRQSGLGLGRVQMVVQPHGIPEAASIGLGPDIAQLAPLSLLRPHFE